MRPHKTLRGHIHYTSSKPGREGVERGREHFTITVHGDREVLPTSLHTLSTGLTAGVMNMSTQGFVGAHSKLRRAETVFAMVPQSA